MERFLVGATPKRKRALESARGAGTPDKKNKGNQERRRQQQHPHKEDEKEMTSPASGFVSCPLCGEDLVRSTAQMHVDRCEGKQEPTMRPLTPGEPVDLSQDDPSETPKPESPRKVKPARLSADKPGARNAMDMMMRSAALRPRLEAFRYGGCWTARAGDPKLCSDAVVLFKKTSIGGGDFRGSRVALEMEKANDSAVESDKKAMLVGAVGAGLFCEQDGDLRARWKRGERCSQFSVGVLKSLLQKSVRRKLSSAAVFCATELLMVDEGSFFRRMPVIIVEDSILHSGFSDLVWLMLAQNAGVALESKHYLRCLEIVREVSSSPIKDPVDWGEDGENDDADEFTQGSAAIGSRGPPSVETLLGRADALTDAQEATVIRSILCRASFGGMKGDMLMLRRVAARWVTRFKYAPGRWIPALDRLHAEATRTSTPLRKTTLPIAGIDFHASPWVLEKVAAKVSDWDDDAARSAMWYLHSSMNGRRNLGAENFAELRDPRLLARETAANVRRSQEVRDKRRELAQIWSRMQPHVRAACEQFVKSKMLV
ncbi:Hypothetical Protein FCC1311_095092 [Hondaea fermentalgiana]|uniref:UBZ4-type domain-containing protein n=1 Tax=Hondaea fermentalgiana TaxID=2315210 RepID=A0A2R5GRR2_9STRA|nr:Hypothetical Protein FCC1311_095092 [Hondaea fermentalgiana]|eukprot:GBG33285.1 Hypothetical Protein FCC1311_095092 [Hondaea fermentalgiana]